jgi:hypothetical protein
MKNDFNDVQAAMTTWLAEPVNQPLFFQNFNRLINPLLANSSPTAEQTGTAIAAVEELYAFVEAQAAVNLGEPPAQALDSIIQSFTIESVPPIDALIQSFVEKGSDAATDILLQGQFSTFFGLTVDQTSYAGAFQSATKAVAMNDLPVRKFNRPETQGSQLMSSAQSPDFEFSSNSVNETVPGAQVDPPTDYGEPSNYGTTTGSTGSGNQ